MKGKEVGSRGMGVGKGVMKKSFKFLRKIFNYYIRYVNYI